MNLKQIDEMLDSKKVSVAFREFSTDDSFIHGITFEMKDRSGVKRKVVEEGFLQMLGVPKKWRKDITGVMYLVYDGEVLAVWLTESSKPYDIYSLWVPLLFYKPESWNKDAKLPEYWQGSNEYYLDYYERQKEDRKVYLEERKKYF